MCSQPSEILILLAFFKTRIFTFYYLDIVVNILYLFAYLVLLRSHSRMILHCNFTIPEILYIKVKEFIQRMSGLFVCLFVFKTSDSHNMTRLKSAGAPQGTLNSCWCWGSQLLLCNLVLRVHLIISSNFIFELLIILTGVSTPMLILFCLDNWKGINHLVIP